MRKNILLVTLFLLIINANLFAEDQSEKFIKAFPDTSTWILVRIGGTKAKQHTGNKVFITIDKKEQKVSGYTSCNYIRSQFSVMDSTLSFPGLSFGKRVCDEATTSLEKQLLESFQKANTWVIKDNLLYLYDKEVLILEFKTTGK